MTDRNPSSLFEFDPDWGEPIDARLTRPILVIALEGWVDAGMGASAAIAELLTSSPTTAIASFDTESLIDQRARRPIARLEDGVTTELTWPAIRLLAGRDRVGADIVYLTGPEPDFRWPTFIDAVVGLTRDLKVRTVVGLGAFPAPTPTPVLFVWHRLSPLSRWIWQDEWGRCTGHSKFRLASKPPSRSPSATREYR